jgi:Protein of unknown function
MNPDTDDAMDPDEADDDEPSPEEWALMRQATPAEAAAVDALVLGQCTDHWQKVAMVVGSSLDDYDARFSHLPYVYMQVRLLDLIERGRIECQGDVMSMRTSEVRLKAGGA